MTVSIIEIIEIIEITEIGIMMTEKYAPDFSKIKCSWKLVLMHVYEKTIGNAEYTFTSVDISKAFGCSQQAASHIILRGINYGAYEKLETFGYRPFLYRITKSGANSAKRLLKIQSDIFLKEEYNNDRR